jgi:hypothetical protein
MQGLRGDAYGNAKSVTGWTWHGNDDHGNEMMVVRNLGTGS